MGCQISEANIIWLASSYGYGLRNLIAIMRKFEITFLLNDWAYFQKVNSMHVSNF